MVQTAFNPGLLVTVILMAVIIVPVLWSNLDTKWKALITVPTLVASPFLMVSFNMLLSGGF